MQAWSPTAVVAATLLIAAQATAADPSAQRAGAPRAIASGVANENPSGGGTVDPDPIDDGSIIVECIGHDGYRATDRDLEQGRPTAGPDMPSTRPPLIPLDPSRC
jgi:hypothetical protein